MPALITWQKGYNSSLMQLVRTLPWLSVEICALNALQFLSTPDGRGPLLPEPSLWPAPSLLACCGIIPCPTCGLQPPCSHALGLSSVLPVACTLLAHMLCDCALSCLWRAPSLLTCLGIVLCPACGLQPWSPMQPHHSRPKWRRSRSSAQSCA